MRRKCKSCNKSFNVDAFGEEYCPYCGAVLDKEDREKIRNRRYHEPMFWWRMIGVINIVVIVIMIVCYLILH